MRAPAGECMHSPGQRRMRRWLSRTDPHWAADTGPTDPAVPPGILVQILLVIVLGVVEAVLRGDLGADLGIAGRAQTLGVGSEGRLGGFALLLGCPVDRRAVLGPDVVALPHPLGR